MTTIVQQPIAIFKDLSNINFGQPTPIGYQIGLDTDAGALSISPGLCYFNSAIPIVANSLIGMRIYAIRAIEATGLFQQNYPEPSIPFLHTMLLSDPMTIPWNKGIDVFLEFFTLPTGVQPVGSRMELSIIPFTERN